MEIINNRGNFPFYSLIKKYIFFLFSTFEFKEKLFFNVYYLKYGRENVILGRVSRSGKNLVGFAQNEFKFVL